MISCIGLLPEMAEARSNMERCYVEAVSRLDVDIESDEFCDNSMQSALTRTEQQALLLVVPPIQPLPSDVIVLVK